MPGPALLLVPLGFAARAVLTRAVGGLVARGAAQGVARAGGSAATQNVGRFAGKQLGRQGVRSLYNSRNAQGDDPEAQFVQAQQGPGLIGRAADTVGGAAVGAAGGAIAGGIIGGPGGAAIGGALGGVAGGVGGFGTAVRTVGGAAVGAGVGFMVGGPGGAAIGAVLGGGLGYSSGGGGQGYGGGYGPGGGGVGSHLLAAGGGALAGYAISEALDGPDTPQVAQSTPMETAPVPGPEAVDPGGVPAAPDAGAVAPAPDQGLVSVGYQDPAAGQGVTPTGSGTERMDVIPQPSTGPNTWGEYQPEVPTSPMDVQGPATTAGAQVQAAQFDPNGPHSPGAMREQTVVATGAPTLTSV